MRHYWLPLFLLALFLPLHLNTATAAKDKEPAATILYTANTFGTLQPCPI